MILERNSTPVDRRTALAGIAGAGLSLGGAASAGTASRVSALGGWSTDAHGLPSYAFTGDVPVRTVTPAGQPYPLDPDPVFLLGNYDLTLFAHVSGRLQLVSGERGWVRLNEPTAATRGNSATLNVTQSGTTRTHDLLGVDGVCASGRHTTRSFGCGTARYLMTMEPGLTIERILSVAPSTPQQRAEPAVVVAVRLTNSGPAPLDVDYVETLLSNPTVMTNRAPAGGACPVTFVNRARMLPGRDGVASDATATSDDPRVLTPINVPNQFNLYPSYSQTEHVISDGEGEPI